MPEEYQQSGKSLIIGITGGIGSGKTTAAEFYESRGFPVIYTDKLAKELMNSDEQLKSKLIARFGKEIYNDTGSLVSRRLAGIVFDGNYESGNNLDELNSIVHPYVIDEMLKLTDKYVKEGKNLIFIESALIYEAELEEGFDYIIVIDSSEKDCINRIVSRGGLTRIEAAARIARQFDPSEKREAADFVIENNGTKDELVKKAEDLLEIMEMMNPPL
ncbi:MAG: dephospho-CoA kinase [Bacteroidota bacterium]|nr:dephospho-CoA kinase [Bacteroidota bacterium]